MPNTLTHVCIDSLVLLPTDKYYCQKKLDNYVNQESTYDSTEIIVRYNNFDEKKPFGTRSVFLSKS